MRGEIVGRLWVKSLKEHRKELLESESPLLKHLQRGDRNMGMKATGIVRKVDELGRVVIPIELRRKLGIEVHDSLEIYTNNEGEIILKKYQRGCVICGEIEIYTVGGLELCKKCIESIAAVNATLSEDEAETQNPK